MKPEQMPLVEIPSLTCIFETEYERSIAIPWWNSTWEAATLKQREADLKKANDEIVKLRLLVKDGLDKLEVMYCRETCGEPEGCTEGCNIFDQIQELRNKLTGN